MDGYLHNCRLTDLLEKSNATVQKESVISYHFVLSLHTVL